MTQRDKWQRRPCVLRYRDWKDKAREAAGVLPPTESIESVVIVAYFSPAASVSKKKRNAAYGTMHRVKPDADNILKACLDALFGDDQKIAKCSIEKRWAIGERTEVEIEISEDNPYREQEIP